MYNQLFTLNVLARRGIFITSPALGLVPLNSMSLPCLLHASLRHAESASQSWAAMGWTGKPCSARSMAGCKICSKVIWGNTFFVQNSAKGLLLYKKGMWLLVKIYHVSPSLPPPPPPPPPLSLNFPDNSPSYLIAPKLFQSVDPGCRSSWHSHIVYWLHWRMTSICEALTLQ